MAKDPQLYVEEARGDGEMTGEISLSVNDAPVELNYFVQEFIDRTVGGMLAGLEGTGEIAGLDISIEGDKATINLNNTVVPLNAFANKIIRNTIMGMISPLKGVCKINRVHISISR